MNDDRLFPIRVPGHFDGGWIGDHTQVLIHRGHQEILFLWFARDGIFLRLESLPFFKSEQEDYFAFKVRYDAAVDAWMRDQGVKPEMLKVRRFVLGDPFPIEIAPYPVWMERVLEEEKEVLEPDVEVSPEWLQRRAIVSAWEEAGCFTFQWNMSEYYLDGTGLVTST